MLYHTYGDALYRILDVQRGGQIPELFKQYPDFVSSIAKGMPYDEEAKALGHFMTHFPDVVGEYVDWIEIENLGSIKSYTTEIEVQKKMLAEKLKPEQPEGDAKAKKKNMPDFEFKIEGEVYISPTVAVKYHHREVA